jgi:hypothetical protein
MPTRKEKALRKLRKEFNRFPNLDIAEPIELGQIGYIDSKKLTFEWRTRLSNLNIAAEQKNFIEELPIVDELYTSDAAVDFKFTLDAKNIGKAYFSFSKGYAIATQVVGMSTIGYEIDDLERSILDAIEKKKIEWDKKWVIVTQIFSSPSYTLLIASSGQSAAEISTSIPIEAETFNIADAQLGLKISQSTKMAYHIVGKENVIPFFKIYQLKGSWKDMMLKLMPYGREYSRSKMQTNLFP